MNRKQKNKKIVDAGKATRKKRKNQICKVFEVKVDKSHLSKKTLHDSEKLFLEAKWLRNHVLATEDVFNVDYKIKEIDVKVGDVFEKREFKVISSQIKQSVIDQLKQNIYNLSAIKKKGRKVGTLKFKSKCNSINLKQFGKTYKIKANK